MRSRYRYSDGSFVPASVRKNYEEETNELLRKKAADEELLRKANNLIYSKVE